MAMRALGGLAIQTIKAIGTFATRALTADVPDSTATGGNARGTNAVDLQTVRVAATQVASGTTSGVLWGTSNVASAANSAAGGSSNTASFAGAVAFGIGNTAAGTASVALGRQSNSRIRTCLAFSANQFAAAGDAQMAQFVLRGTTTDAATGVRLTEDGGAASAFTIMNLADTSAIAFRGTLVASSAGTSAKSWVIEGLIRRGVGVATTALPTAATVTSVFGDAGLATAAVAVSADTTNGGINITVNGVAATTIRWVCRLDAVEVAG